MIAFQDKQINLDALINSSAQVTGQAKQVWVSISKQNLLATLRRLFTKRIKLFGQIRTAREQTKPVGFLSDCESEKRPPHLIIQPLVQSVNELWPR